MKINQVFSHLNITVLHSCIYLHLCRKLQPQAITKSKTKSTKGSSYCSSWPIDKKCNRNMENKQVSSMIHSARPTVSPVASNEHCFCFVLFCQILKSGEGQTTCSKTMIPTGHDCGSAKWINKQVCVLNHQIQVILTVELT